MSEATSGSLFDSGFASILPRWFGRIEESKTWQNNAASTTFEDRSSIKGWGYRYKVRIVGWHSGNKTELKPEEMVMANVVLPVTSGSGIGGYGETPSLAAGTMVTGFFMDGMGGQEPYIDGVLGNSQNEVPKKRSEGPTSGFDIYTDLYNPKAKVPDNLRLLNDKVLNTFDTYHINTYAWKTQQQDKNVIKPLASTRKCKKNNSEMKGIQRTIKNLLGDIERIKKETTKAQGFIADAQSLANQIQPYISSAASEAASFMKTIIGGVRGYILSTIEKGIRKAVPFLFPTQIAKFNKEKSKSLNTISCVFGKIVKALQQQFESLLKDILDKFINAPMCAVENIIGKLIDTILNTVLNAVNAALTPIIALISAITGKALNLIMNLFTALDFISGILSFFSCDEEPSCSEYDEITQSKGSTNGGDTAATPGNPTTEQATGQGNGSADGPVSASITNNAAEASTEQLSVGQSNAETQAVAAQEQNLIREQGAKREQVDEEFGTTEQARQAVQSGNVTFF